MEIIINLLKSLGLPTVVIVLISAQLKYSTYPCITSPVISPLHKVIVIILTLLGWMLIIIFCLYKQFTKCWEHCKSTEKLLPSDIDIKHYHYPAVDYVSFENTAIQGIRQKTLIILVGVRQNYKSTIAYNTIKTLKGFTVIIPKKETDVNKIRFFPVALLFIKKLVLLLDNTENNSRDCKIIEKLQRTHKKLKIFVTCLPGREKEYLEYSSGFEMIKLPTFASSSYLLIKDYNDLTQKSRTILKALKLLKYADRPPHKKAIVRSVCSSVFSCDIREDEWIESITMLEERGFITVVGKALSEITSRCSDEIINDYKNPLEFSEHFSVLTKILSDKKDLTGLLYLGNNLCNEEQWNMSQSCYEDILSRSPRYAPALFAFGHMLTKQAEERANRMLDDEAARLYQLSKEKYVDAIKISPKYAFDYNNLGYTLTGLGEIKENKGQTDEAKVFYKEAESCHQYAINLKEDFSAAYRSLAYAVGKLGKVEDSLNYYKKAIEYAPNSPFAYNLRGHELAQMGKNEEAENDYKKAIEIEPNYYKAYNNLGYLLAKLGSNRYQDAEKAYEKAIEIESNYIVTYVNWGRLLTAWGNYSGAIKKYEKALKVNFNYAQAHDAKGYALAKIGDNESDNVKRNEFYDEAEKEYRTAIGMNNSPSYINLGYLLKQKGDKESDPAKKSEFYASAENTYKEALHKNKDCLDALLGLAITLERLEKYAEARGYLEHTMTKYPDNDKVKRTHECFTEKAREYKEAGKDLKRQGDSETNPSAKVELYHQAEKKYRLALEINPFHPSAHKNRANVLAMLGQNEEAEKEYQKASEYADNKEYPKNNREHGIFLSKIGRKVEAKEELKLAITLFKKRGNEEEAERVEKLLQEII